MIKSAVNSYLAGCFAGTNKMFEVDEHQK